MSLSEKEHKIAFYNGQKYGETLYKALPLLGDYCPNCYMQGVAHSALLLFIMRLETEQEVDDFIETFTDSLKKSRAEALPSSQPERTIN